MLKLFLIFKIKTAQIDKVYTKNNKKSKKIYFKKTAKINKVYTKNNKKI